MGATKVFIMHDDLGKLTLLQKLYFFRKGREVTLEPANANYKPIKLDAEQVLVQGKLLAVWRKV